MDSLWSRYGCTSVVYRRQFILEFSPGGSSAPGSVATQEAEQFRHCDPSMANRQLLPGAQFGKGPMQWRGKEKRIVPKSTGSARLLQDLAFDLSPCRKQAFSRLSRHDYAYEAGCSRFFTLHQFEQERIVLGIVGIRSCKACRKDAGAAAQRIHL